MLPVVWALITPLLKQVNAKLAGDAKRTRCWSFLTLWRVCLRNVSGQ
jgi:hypothetical protein